MDADRIIADIASAQHSTVTRRQLLDGGVSRRALEHRLADGRLVSMHAGVYRPAGHPRSWHQTLMAAVLAAGPGAAISHRGAGFLHGMPGVGPQAEVSVEASRAPRGLHVVVHRVTQLRPPDLGVVDGIPCTRAARTLIDLAAVVGGTALEAALDNALSRRLVSVEYLTGRVEALGRQGRAGTGTLVALLRQRTKCRPRTQGEFERRLLAVLSGVGLPAPQTQFEVALPGGRRAFLDFAYPEVKLGLEADSYRHHSSRTDWGRDRTRNRLLTAIGWRILPVTWDDLADPTEVLALVSRGLKQKPHYVG